MKLVIAKMITKCLKRWSTLSYSCACIVALSDVTVLSADEPAPVEQNSFSAAESKAKALRATQEGRSYSVAFSKAIQPTVSRLIDPMLANNEVEYHFEMIATIEKDGRISTIISSSDAPIERRIKASLKDLHVPKPPQPDWTALFKVDIYK